MTQQSDEQWLREQWERFAIYHNAPWVSISFGPFYESGWETGPCASEDEAMLKSRAFTESRKQEIEEIREEIAYFDYEVHQDITRIPQRILSKRLLPELERLQKGLKQP